jgi:archaemetzincin
VSGEIVLAFLNGFRPRWASRLEEGVAAAFGHRVRTTSVDLPVRRFLDPNRGQHHATLLLAEVLRHRPEGADRIVGLTDVDLYIPVLTFVFGQAQLSGAGSVVSTFRLHAEYYGLPADEVLLRDRTIKETVHELGHNFGLVHCPDYRCVMSSSTYVEDVDLKEPGLCPDCRAVLVRDGVLAG